MLRFGITHLWTRGLEMYITATEDNNVITLDKSQKFGNKHIQGMQFKGVISMNKEHLFVKLDELNPSVNGEWENRYDYQYSSVSEAVISCLTRHIKDDQFHSVDYSFHTIVHEDTIKTGTTSPIFLRENEVEQILSSGHTANDNVCLDINTYATEVIDKPVAESYKRLTEALVENGVPEQEAKDFLIKQAAFDLIVGNEDRIVNPSNFVTAYDVVTKTARPINLDYGRALQIPVWTSTMEAKYDIEWLEEDIEDFTSSVLSKNNSLIAGLNHQKALEFLNENGFQPFQIDLQAVYDDLDRLGEHFKDSPVEKFGTAKIATMKALLEHLLVKELYMDTACVLSKDDLKDLNDQQPQVS